MGILLDHRRQAIERCVADIPVFAKLHPGPAVADIVNSHKFAGQGLRCKRRAELRRNADQRG